MTEQKQSSQSSESFENSLCDQSQSVMHRSAGSPIKKRMNTLTLVEAPKSGSAQWWPDLYLRKGRSLFQVSPLQAARLMDGLREREVAATGSSKNIRDIKLHDVDGKHIGHVSFNGRVWLHDIDGNKEIPLPGIKTAAQHEAEGWRDCR